MRAFLVRTGCTGLALWVADLIVPGIYFVWGNSWWQKVGIVALVAVIFGVVNGFIKPIVQILAIPLYILTLGLIHLVINALMLMLTSWITGNTIRWGLEVSGFWSAVFGAIVISIVGWLLAMVMRESDEFHGAV